jgi:hypothetical protein
MLARAISQIGRIIDKEKENMSQNHISLEFVHIYFLHLQKLILILLLLHLIQKILQIGMEMQMVDIMQK